MSEKEEHSPPDPFPILTIPNPSPPNTQLQLLQNHLDSLLQPPHGHHPRSPPLAVKTPIRSPKSYASCFSPWYFLLPQLLPLSFGKKEN
ncbi:hypothetical protein MRB53_022707 [Persea americana]|uniref:Uncharacterized protein n=1 Tax=Persea americana TaxID=3435 RepID=A0ACC2L8M0_PERAE|nr:hypothetical protein MRB53_022707 [Persea americana]